MLNLTEAKQRVEESTLSIKTISDKLRAANEAIEKQKEDLADMTRRTSELEAILEQLLETLEGQKSEFLLDNDERPSSSQQTEALMALMPRAESLDITEETSRQMGQEDSLPKFKKPAWSGSAPLPHAASR